MDPVALGAATLGFSCLVAVLMLRWKKKAPKLMCWCACIASVCLTGGMVAILSKILQQAGAGAGGLFGVPANVVLCTVGVAVFGVFCLEADPRKGKGGVKNYTLALAVAPPLLIGAAGAGVLPGWLTDLRNFLGETAIPLATFFGA